MIIGDYTGQKWYSSTTVAPEKYPLDVVPVADPETDGFKGNKYFY